MFTGRFGEAESPKVGHMGENKSPAYPLINYPNTIPTACSAPTFRFLAMSVSLLVAALITLGWNITLVALTVAYKQTESVEADSREERSMRRTFREIRAEVGTPELVARTDALNREEQGGAAESVRSRVTDASMEIEVEVPYAKASVTVSAEGDNDEVRRCSVCMN